MNQRASSCSSGRSRHQGALHGREGRLARRLLGGLLRRLAQQLRLTASGIQLATAWAVGALLRRPAKALEAIGRAICVLPDRHVKFPDAPSQRRVVRRKQDIKPISLDRTTDVEHLNRVSPVIPGNAHEGPQRKHARVRGDKIAPVRLDRVAAGGDAVGARAATPSVGAVGGDAHAERVSDTDRTAVERVSSPRTEGRSGRSRERGARRDLDARARSREESGLTETRASLKARERGVGSKDGCGRGTRGKRGQVRHGIDLEPVGGVSRGRAESDPTRRHSKTNQRSGGAGQPQPGDKRAKVASPLRGERIPERFRIEIELRVLSSHDFTSILPCASKPESRIRGMTGPARKPCIERPEQPVQTPSSATGLRGSVRKRVPSLRSGQSSPDRSKSIPISPRSAANFKVEVRARVESCRSCRVATAFAAECGGTQEPPGNSLPAIPPFHARVRISCSADARPTTRRRSAHTRCCGLRIARSRRPSLTEAPQSCAGDSASVEVNILVEAWPCFPHLRGGRAHDPPTR